MRVLAFDTATPATTVALADLAPPAPPAPAPLPAPAPPPAGSTLELRDDPTPGSRPNHTRRLLELIEEALARTQTGWSEIDRIAVGIGPGTFTGLRIGIATAHALARARRLPLVGVSTLAALALPAADGAPERDVLAVLDARRGEAFVAGWTFGGTPGHHPPALPAAVLAPEALAAAGAQLRPGALAVGDGAVKFARNLKRSGLIVPPEDSELHRVTARAHCRLAIDLEPGRLGDVQPEYLRLPDAEISRRT
ncbi:MAG TPA: tRNA (adenosine(37)-N6)-threonylcarbamoyltransferase complex dimerization subunit type 1 TsaB [Solirubrobacteraceae bacterium]|nr:tRNA (adenosine(37)-N6)-threonylcarbamoyltransferase complex dimerization subunit type 1 TsaB [Solirubrobacteraceae bacterium]